MLLTKYSTYTMPDASHSTLNTYVNIGTHVTGVSVILFLISPNASVATLVHINSPCFIQSIIGDRMVPFNESTIKGGRPVKIANVMNILGLKSVYDRQNFL
jgi:hypothetical protein